ncbi:endonuclease/exonuclease/phosphatase family protein [Tardisphaera miroshnichenkoae]
MRFKRSPSEDERRLAIRADLSDELGPFSFAVTHLSLDEESRVDQVQRISSWIGNDERAILVGDFNDVPGSRAITHVRLRDAATQEGPTFPSTGERLDYAFLGPAWRVLSYGVPSVNFSDHFPVVVEIEGAKAP